MNSFKDVAYQILKEAGEPLHFKEITKRALEHGRLKTAGKTPEATMGAQLITDVNKLGERSRFYKAGPATFGINPASINAIEDAAKIEEEVEIRRVKAINTNVSSKQKGDIAEARIAELVTLFGEEALSCYRPISDDEGIDLIVKQKGSLKTLYIQIKSRWQDTSGTLIVDVKSKGIMNNYAMGIVVCMFDVEQADIWDYLWFIPAPDYVRLGTPNADGSIVRFASNKNLEKMGTWADYLIPKQELADKLIEHMGRI